MAQFGNCFESEYEIGHSFTVEYSMSLTCPVHKAAITILRK